MFEPNLIEFDSFLQYNEILGRGASKTVYDFNTFSSLCASLKLFDVKVKMFYSLLCVLVVTDIELLMSMKGLKWHGTK